MRSTTTTSMGAFRGSNLRPNAAREVKMELPAGGAIRQFGGDIEVLGSQPVRAYDLIVVHAVGHSDVTPHEEGAAPDHGAINMHANTLTSPGMAGADFLTEATSNSGRADGDWGKAAIDERSAQRSPRVTVISHQDAEGKGKFRTIFAGGKTTGGAVR